MAETLKRESVLDAQKTIEAGTEGAKQIHALTCHQDESSQCW
jgi:hypothetical protein